MICVYAHTRALLLRGAIRSRRGCGGSGCSSGSGSGRWLSELGRRACDLHKRTSLKGGADVAAGASQIEPLGEQRACRRRDVFLEVRQLQLKSRLAVCVCV